MIVGIGFDLAEPHRIAAAVEREGTSLQHHVFTPAEWQQAHATTDAADALAICFAAKEACLKALGTGWSNGISMRDVELLMRKDGRPELALSSGAASVAARAGVRQVHVTVTTLHGTTAALVILED